MNDVEITKDRIGAEVERAKRACPTCHRSSATPSQDASALVEAAYRAGHRMGRCGGDALTEDEDWAGSSARAALTAWEAQHG